MLLQQVQLLGVDAAAGAGCATVPVRRRTQWRNEDGRTDLLGPLLEAGVPPNFQNQHGVSLMQTCAYYGDVSAIRGLLARGSCWLRSDADRSESYLLRLTVV